VSSLNPPASDDLLALIGELDRAVEDCNCQRTTCDSVKESLERYIGPDSPFLDASFLQSHSDHYARRLLHRDPDGRYSVIIMVWGTDQGTAIHDHGGLWCVECVYRGRIRVHSYDIEDGPTAETHNFRKDSTVIAGCGEAGALIPPFDYHIIENPFDEPAVTVHVYGGEMSWCHCYEPAAEGGYERVRRDLQLVD